MHEEKTAAYIPIPKGRGLTPQLVIMGRLIRDPELRRTGSGTAVASFTLAVDRDFADKQTGERETDFIDCVAWRSTAEFVAKYFKKGQLAVVSGRLQIRPWEAKDGSKHRSAEILVGDIYFAGARSKPQEPAQAPTEAEAPGGYPTPPASPAPEFEIPEDGELPY